MSPFFDFVTHTSNESLFMFVSQHNPSDEGTLVQFEIMFHFAPNIEELPLFVEVEEARIMFHFAPNIEELPLFVEVEEARIIL